MFGKARKENRAKSQNSVRISEDLVSFLVVKRISSAILIWRSLDYVQEF